MVNEKMDLEPTFEENVENKGTVEWSKPNFDFRMKPEGWSRNWLILCINYTTTAQSELKWKLGIELAFSCYRKNDV